MLKINRRRPHRDYSWPPPTPGPKSSISNNHSLQSNQKVTNTLEKQSIGHKIDHIREEKVGKLSPSSLKNNEIRKSMSSSPSKSLDGHSERERTDVEWPPMYHYKDKYKNFSSPQSYIYPQSHNIRRTYSLPEDEITNQGFFEPIRMFWESISSPTSSLDRDRARKQHQRNFNSILNGKKWKSFENFNEPITIDDEDGDDKVLQLLVTEKETVKLGGTGIEWYVNWGQLGLYLQSWKGF